MTRVVFHSVILSVLVALFYATNSFASTEASSDLSGLLNNFNAMSANFSQVLYDNSGTVIERHTGSMALERPGKFRWQVNNPNQQLLIADGRYLWIYDVDLQQATKQRMDSSKSNSPASLLSGSVSNLENRFTVSQMKKADPGQWFELKPRENKDLFNWIQLHFIDNKLVEMHLLDNLGQLSTFAFTQVEVNPNLPKNTFVFQAPKGVDVVDN
jgi:outer membrane lipoprotein carrier protein